MQPAYASKLKQKLTELRKASIKENRQFASTALDVFYEPKPQALSVDTEGLSDQIQWPKPHDLGFAELGCIGIGSRAPKYMTFLAPR